MDRKSIAGQPRGSNVLKGALSSSLRPGPPTTMRTTPTQALMELADELDGCNWLTEHNESSGLGEYNEKQKDQIAREFKLAECLKELAAFQNAAMEEEDDEPVKPKDLNTTLFSSGHMESNCKAAENLSNKGGVDAPSQGVVGKRCDVAAAKDQPKCNARAAPQKPWSFSTKSPGRPYTQAGGSFAMGGKVNHATTKSPAVTKSRQVVKQSSPLVFGRRMSATPEKRRQSLGKSPVLCKRMSRSPVEKPRPAESKKGNLGVQGKKQAGRKKPWERTSPMKGGTHTPDGKVSKLTDRQKEILKKVAGSPIISGRKQVLSKERANGLRSSVDLSVAGRRARRLSQVLRNENDIMLQNQQYVQELEQLRNEFACQDQEVERARSAGMLLKQLCANQAEELKALKGAFPAILKEMSDLREDCHKQENELQTAHSIKLSLEAEISRLQGRVESLTSDIKQTRALNTILAERVQQNQKTQCHSCRLNSTRKPFNKEVSPSSAAKRSGPPLGTPPGRRDSRSGQKCSPKRPAPHKEDDNARRLEENKKPAHNATGELTQHPKIAAEQQEPALRERSENAFQELPSKGGPTVDALKSRINSLLLTASQALETQHRAL